MYHLFLIQPPKSEDASLQASTHKFVYIHMYVYAYIIFIHIHANVMFIYWLGSVPSRTSEAKVQSAEYPEPKALNPKPRIVGSIFFSIVPFLT